MRITEKYYRIYVRFLKEHGENKAINGITMLNYLPHLYIFKTEDERLEFINIILHEYVNDLLHALGERLNLVNYNEFRFNGLKFDGLIPFFKHAIVESNLYNALDELDYYLELKNKQIEIKKSSVMILDEFFFHIK